MSTLPHLIVLYSFAEVLLLFDNKEAILSINANKVSISSILVLLIRAYNLLRLQACKRIK